MQREPPRYGNRITIRPGDNDCSNAGLTAQEFREFIQRSIDDYWNSVPTSRLQFVVGESIDIDETGTTSNALGLASVGEIVVGCSDSATTFSSGSTLAVGGMSTTQARGVVLINNTAGTRFDDVDEIARVSTFAHELGHAIGIGHSRVEYALMYYSVTAGVVNEHLTEDDADAITYLSPTEKKAGGLAGACGTIDLDNDQNGDPGNFLLTLLFGFIIAVMLSKKASIRVI